MIEPNSKERFGNLEITCYGRGMIMVDHPQLTAPIPIGPKDEDRFWNMSSDERLITILDYVDAGIDWTNPDALLGIGEDIHKARSLVSS